MNKSAITVKSKNNINNIADSLIAIIRKKPENFFSLEKLSKKLMISCEEVIKAAGVAAEWEYRIKIRKRLGIAFVSAPDLLTDTEIKYKLKTKWLAHTIYSYSSVKSTNDIASLLADNNVPDGSLIVSEQQTKGRGRFGRVWHSPPGSGIYLSILLRPKIKPEDAPALSIVTAAALADTISEYLPGQVQMKWPNDILIGKRKVAGILTELSADRGKVNHVIIGVGINVNQGVGHFPDDLKKVATSIRRALKRKVNRIDLLKLFLKNFERDYGNYLSTKLTKMLPRIRRYSTLLGSEVTVLSGQNRISGKAISIENDGSLIIKSSDKLNRVIAGEVTILKE